MTDDSSSAVELADRIAAICYGIVGWLAVGSGLLLALGAVRILADAGLSAGTGLLSAIALIAAFVVVALGVFVNPGTRRRLHRRHDPSAFGRARSVDRRTIRSAEDCTERCVECRARIERGLVRRYREEYVVAGLPVYTSSIGYNHYCLECATVGGKVPDAGPSTGDAATDRDELPDGDPSLERR